MLHKNINWLVVSYVIQQLEKTQVLPVNVYLTTGSVAQARPLAKGPYKPSRNQLGNLGT